MREMRMVVLNLQFSFLNEFMKRKTLLDIKIIKEKVSSLRILVVEDEELIRVPMGDFMERFFCDVVCAEDGEDALKKFHELGPFDIVFTDIRMPKMNGLELIKELRLIDNELFIAVASGDPEDTKNDFTHCDVVMEKPTSFNAILKMLSKMVESKGL